MLLNEGDYLASLVSRKDGSTYVAYYRVLKTLDPILNLVEFVDDMGMRVRMRPEYVRGLRAVYPNEKHPKIDLEAWRDGEG